VKQVLLDYPWSISDTLNGDSPAFNVLQSFDRLIKEKRLQAAQFMTREQLDAFWALPRRGTGSAWASIGSIAEKLWRQIDQGCQASPVPEVPGLSGDWKSSLRDEMRNLDDWRNPQIVIAEARRNAWPQRHEVSICFDECDELPAMGPYDRVVVQLEEYDLHPYALADFDPWDLTNSHPSPNPDVNYLAHPCILPKPPKLAEVPLDQLADALRQLRQREGEKLFYIPPRNWSPTQVMKGRWRNGRAFPYDEIGGHRGFIDARGIVWEWDDAERHWDVQSQPYCRISHTGDEIGK
jgi:hypothetical protein